MKILWQICLPFSRYQFDCFVRFFVYIVYKNYKLNELDETVKLYVLIMQ